MLTHQQAIARKTQKRSEATVKRGNAGREYAVPVGKKQAANPEMGGLPPAKEKAAAADKAKAPPAAPPAGRAAAAAAAATAASMAAWQQATWLAQS